MATGNIQVNLFDGARRRVDPASEILITVRPQYKTEPVFADFVQNNPKLIPNIPVPSDGSGYAILASAKGYEDAGFSPVEVSKYQTVSINLMMLRRGASFQFARARWDQLGIRPALRNLLMGFETNTDNVAARYSDLMEHQQESLATLLNITAAFDLLDLTDPAQGFATPLEYLRALEWGIGIRRDRFFAYASDKLLAKVHEAAGKNLFEEEKLPGVFHHGASESWKQTAFGEANVQITFHDRVSPSGSSAPHLRVELDMDYYSDSLAHALLEVIPNTLSFGQRKTSPRQIYVMRWIAGKTVDHDFDPLYTIA